MLVLSLQLKLGWNSEQPAFMSSMMTAQTAGWLCVWGCGGGGCGCQDGGCRYELICDSTGQGHNGWRYIPGMLSGVWVQQSLRPAPKMIASLAENVARCYILYWSVI